MSKLIQKIEDEIERQKLMLNETTKYNMPRIHPKEKLRVLKSFHAFATDAAQDLTEEEFAEYEQNALAVWEE